MGQRSSTGLPVTAEHIGTKLEEHYGPTADQHAATLAFHFMRNKSPGAKNKLAHYARIAAEEAFNAYDYPRAIRFYHQVLDARDASIDDVVTADMLFGIGRARVIDGNLRDGERDLERACALYTALGRTEKAVEVATFPIVYAYGYEVSFRLVDRVSAIVTPGSREWGVD